MGTLLHNINPFRRLINRISQVLDSIKINTIAEQESGHVPQIIKHRNGCGKQLAGLTNFYFGMAGVHIRYRRRAREWQRWEVDCFRMLNQDRYDAFAVGDDTICIDKIPGKSLWVYLTNGTITRSIVNAAARELRRAHRFWSDAYQGRWSHGDASASNFIYDLQSRRVRLIDFEIMHDASLSDEERHADDLLVFLLDLAGYVSRRRWLPMALSFLKTYDRREVVAELRKRLFVPCGLARIWWNVRTNAKGAKYIGRRLDELARAIDVMPEFRVWSGDLWRAGMRRIVMPRPTCLVDLPGDDAGYPEGQLAHASD